MRTELIPIANLVMDKPDPADRTFRRDFCESLAVSLQQDGLLYKPVVQPVPGKPNFYRVLDGRHRVYTAGKILKWTEIACEVADGLDADLARSAVLAGNLFRNSLDDAQTAKALIEWQAIYAKKHPDASGTGRAQKVVAEAKKAVAAAQAAGEEAAPDVVAAAAGETTKPFAEVVAGTLGVKKSTAAKLARQAKNLTVEQVDLLTAAKASKETFDAVAKLETPAAVDAAVKLIASGMDHAEAVRQAVKQKAPKVKASKGTEGSATAAPVRPKKPKAAELTDDEWIDQNCGVLLKLLRHKTPFRRDAILYRRISEGLTKFRAHCKAPIAEAKASGGNGGFWSAVYRTVMAAHPRDWQVCGLCNGTGKDREASDPKNNMCKKCFGAAYYLIVEK